MQLSAKTLKIIIVIESILIMLIGTALFLQWQKPTTGATNTEPSSSITPVETPVTSGTLPAQVLDLTNWKLTLPIGNEEKPSEIKQPALENYQLDPWFVTTDDGKGVRFRAPVKSVTTSGSNYPRSELREMVDKGTEKADWSTSTGTHTMTIDQAITAVPKVKKHVVAGQIHDADDDIIVIRLEYPTLYVNVDGDNVVTLDTNYTLGKRFSVKFVAQNNQTKIYYNNSSTPTYTLNKAYNGAYFKAGAYTQSNCEREKDPKFCTEDNYGEVVIYDLDVSHQ